MLLPGSDGRSVKPVAGNVLGDTPKPTKGVDLLPRQDRFQYGSNLFFSGNRMFVRSMTDLYCIGDPQAAMVLSKEHQ